MGTRAARRSADGGVYRGVNGRTKGPVAVSSEDPVGEVAGTG